MKTLAEILHDERYRLSGFARHVEQLLSAEFSYEAKDSPLYTIKSRVKSYTSVAQKLRKIVQSDDPQSSSAERLLYDGGHSIDELFAIIPDLIGIRAVWFFEHAKQRAALHFLDNSADWFIVDTRDGKPWIKVFRPHGSPIIMKELDQFAVDPKPSGYTSIHVVGHLSDRDLMAREYSGFHCEVQLRTLLEEAWGELSHYLEYKGLTSPNALKAVRQAKDHLGPLEAQFAAIHVETKFIRTHRLHLSLQLSHNYPVTSRGILGTRFTNEYNRAYAKRQSGDYEGSRRILQAIVENKQPKYVPEDHANKLQRRLLCDIAACYLHERKVDEAQTVLDRAKDHLDDDQESFWIYLRSAEVYRQLEQYANALECCSRAHSRLERGKLEWCSTFGMEADLLSYTAFVHWTKAYKVIAGDWKRFRDIVWQGMLSNETNITGSFNSAIDNARRAYDKAHSAPSTHEVRLRTATLLYLLTTWSGTKHSEANELHAYIESARGKGPFDLAQLSWGLLTGNSPEHDPAKSLTLARTYCTQATELLRRQAPLVRDRISKRLNILEHIVDEFDRSKRTSWLTPGEWFEAMPG